MATARLYYASRSPFCRKIIACAVVCGIQEYIFLESVDPWTDEELRKINPLCKVPVLTLSNGLIIYDSRVIAECFNEWAEGNKLIPQGERRWDALRREALGDGLADAVVRRFVDRLGPSGERIGKVVARQERAIMAALDDLESTAPAWTALDPDVGHLAVAAALGYLTARSPEVQWSQARPLLAAWFCAFCENYCWRVAVAPDAGYFGGTSGVRAPTG